MIRGLMGEEEWAFFEPFVKSKTGRPGEHRRTLDGIFWIVRTGAPWRDLPEELGEWNSVYQQFRRWSLSGLWDLLLETLAGSGAAPKTVQMIDATVIRAHHQAAGAKGDSKASSWPFARRLHEQDSRPHQRRRSPARLCPHAGRSARRNGL